MPDGQCPICAKTSPTDPDGLIRFHRTTFTYNGQSRTETCPGGGRKPRARDEDPSGVCPTCDTAQPLLAPDDLRSHLGAEGEYCSGSRGAPK